MSDRGSFEQEASRILDLLVSIPFESCYALSRDLPNSLNRKPSIYAVKHRTEGLLYIGKAKYPKERFKDGHKAFFWSWLERYNPEDVRLVVVALSHPQWTQLLFRFGSDHSSSNLSTLQCPNSDEGLRRCRTNT